MQRVLEGEKALRSECARKLRDVEKKLAALNPLTAGWWPASASPGAQSEQLLLRQKAELNRQLDAHSKQVGVEWKVVMSRACMGRHAWRKLLGRPAPPCTRCCMPCSSLLLARSCTLQTASPTLCAPALHCRSRSTRWL